MLFFTILEADGSPAWQMRKIRLLPHPHTLSVNDQHRQYLNPGLFCDSAPVLFPPAPGCLPTVNQAQKQRKLLQSTFPKRRALAARFVHYVADMTVAWRDKVAHKRVRAGPPSRRTGPLSMVSAEYLTRPTLDPIPDSLQDVVSIGSLWNKLIQPQGLFGNKVTDNSAALILLSLPSPPHPSSSDREEKQRRVWVTDEPSVRGAGLSERILTERKREMYLAALLGTPVPPTRLPRCPHPCSSSRFKEGGFHKEPKGGCQTSQGLKNRLSPLLSVSQVPMAQPSWSFFFLWRGKLSADTRRYLFSLAGPAGVWLFATRVLRARCYDEGRGPFQGSSCEPIRGCRHKLQIVVLLMHRGTWAVKSSNKTQETIFRDSTKESMCITCLLFCKEPVSPSG